MFIPIPTEFKIFTNTGEDVNLLVGRNGSGKSMALSKLAKFYRTEKKSVIAIANTIHDKFIRFPGINLLRDRGGRKRTYNTFKRALIQSNERNDSQTLENISKILAFVGYNPRIGLEIIINRKFTESKLRISNLISNLELDENISSLVYKIIFELDRGSKTQTNENSILWIGTSNEAFNKSDNTFLLQVLKHESLLKKKGVITGLKLYLKRNSTTINLEDASSGELSLIKSLIFISNSIRSNSVILVDEPENSLHPTWQKDYIKFLLGLFYYYSPKIIIATHSPLIVSGSEYYHSGTKIYELENFEIKSRISDRLNIEEIFLKHFHISTPENNYLSEYLTILLNKLGENTISINDFNILIEQIEKTIFDDRQLDLLSSIKNISLKIINNNG